MSKDVSNVYYKTRKKLGLSREKASILLESISPERIERIENEKYLPYPEEVLIMSQKYNEPELCNYYCSRECPIGRKYVPEVKVGDLSQIVLEILDSVNSAKNMQEKLIEIAADGEIDNPEIDDFIKIQKNLERISVTVEALQLWSEQKIKKKLK